MFFKVRWVSDWLWAKLPLLVVIVLLGTYRPAFGQEKEETSQETNQKIEQLAALASSRPADIPIGSGDLLHIDVFDVPELSRDVRVSDAGDISYPLIPVRIVAAGLSPFQLQTRLEQMLVENGLVSHPQVSVFVKEQNSQPVSVVGAVVHTMTYQVMRPTTLLEVISAAGGITDDAGSVVIVTRPARPNAAKMQPASATSDSGADEEIITIRLQDLLESGSSVYNVPVYGGDMISIPRAGIVYVTGFGVAQPGGYVLQNRGEQVTVMKAIALAHGMTTFAKPDSAVIMRTNPATGAKDQIPVFLKQIQEHKAEDVALKSNDILYVPDSAGKKALAHGAQAALTIATGLAIYRY